MNVNALWERYTTLSLRHRGVRSKWIEAGPLKLHSLFCSLSSKLDEKAPSKRVVCVHGLGSSGSSYALLLPELAQLWHEVYAPSAPSHGLSPSLKQKSSKAGIQGSSPSSRVQSALYEAWENVLLYLSAEEPISLLGISLGGAVSIRFASRHPERVASLILCSPAGAPIDSDGMTHLRGVFKMTERGDGLRFLQTLYDQPPWWSPLLAPMVRRSLGRPEAQDIINQLKPGDGLSPDELSTLQAPTLFIWGKRERVLPSSSLQFFRKYASSLWTFLEPERFSHAPHRESPKELAQLVMSWATEHTQSRNIVPSEVRPNV